jgi:hypothetical protein
MKELLIPRNAPLAHAERIVPEKAIPPFMDLLCAQSDLRISIFDWTFANLHVKLLPGVRFRSKDCERLLHNRAQRLRLGTHASRHVETIHTWRGPLEENSRLWLGQNRAFVSDR